MKFSDSLSHGSIHSLQQRKNCSRIWVEWVTIEVSGKTLQLFFFPLTELLKAKAKFVWSSECQQAFDSVKALLCSSSVLAALQFDRLFMWLLFL